MHSKRLKTTIILEPSVRDMLKHIARKDQSYNQLILDLIKLHKETVQEGKGDQTTPLMNNGADTTNQQLAVPTAEVK